MFACPSLPSIGSASLQNTCPNFSGTMKFSDAHSSSETLRLSLAASGRCDVLHQHPPAVMGSPRFLAIRFEHMSSARPRRPLDRLAFRRFRCCLPPVTRRRLPRQSTFSGLIPDDLRSRCLRFKRCVTTPLARLASGWRATAFSSPDFHRLGSFPVSSGIPAAFPGSRLISSYAYDLLPAPKMDPGETLQEIYN